MKYSWNILFVDDEANVLNALRRSLRKEPFELHFAQGPEEAMEVLKEKQIDVAISDHLMPSMDGLTFLKLVKDMYPHVIRIILTGHANLQMAIEAINEGEVFRFLTKPWNDIELKMTLKGIFDYLELKKENQSLHNTVKKQRDFIKRLNEEHPGIFEVSRDESGAIILSDDLEL